MTAPVQGVGPEAGVAAGGEAIGVGVAGEALPFTGSLLTIPLALVGLALTFGGWLLHRLGREPAPD